MVAACGRFGPHLHVGIDNTGGPKEVAVTVDSSGAGMTGGEDVTVPAWQGAEWRVPLGSTWDVKVDGYPVITRCFNDGKMTLDLKLQSVNRKPLSDTLFAVPSGFK
jgi:hypothetical protein